MVPAVELSSIFLAYAGLVFGSSLFLLLAGGAKRMLILIQPSSMAPGQTLNFGLGPMVVSILLLGAAALFTPSLLPGAGLAAGLILVSMDGSRPASFWGFVDRNPFRDLADGLQTLLTILWPIVLLLALSSALFLGLGLPLEPQPALLKFLEARELREIIPFLIYALVLAPIWEEVFFRGTLFPWLAGRLPIRQAQWLSALAFGAVHFHGPTLIPLTVLGSFLAGVYRNRGSLLPAILVHSLFNANTCVLLLLGRTVHP